MNRPYFVFRALSALILLSTAARPQTQGDARRLMRALADATVPTFNFVPSVGHSQPSNRAPGEGQGQKVEGPYAAGFEQFRHAQYERAVELLSQVSDGDRNYTKARYYLGVSYSRLKRYPEAAATFRQVIDLDPTNLFAHYELAKASFAFDKKTTEQERQFLREKSPDLLLYLNEYMGGSVPVAGSESLPAGDPIYVPGRDGVTKPTILYKEKARYTEIARQNYVDGTVVLTVVFTKEGQITGIRVIRALPDGLTYQAIDAARKIRFQPATKDGQPVNVRANLEWTFNLY